ncbi:MAG: diaminopimelate epimerase [Planctomycetota bacterium]|jgi:diaminopimelate epimerase
MSDIVEFWKLTAAGNDFACIDNRDGRFHELISDQQAIGHFVHRLCERHTGIGADGVIFANTPEIDDVADIAARIFEWDGSEVELCGNGTACFVHWATRMGYVPSGEIQVLTPAGIVRGQNGTERYVRVCISLPKDMKTDLDVPIQGGTVPCDFVITGIPHTVTFVDDIAAADVAGIGPKLRHHEMFKPRGVNANFVQVLGEGEIAMRTWEFGVEGETLACGTGSAASAILAARRFGWMDAFDGCDEPIRVHTRGGDVLRVFFSLDDNGEFDDLCLESVVTMLYHATLHPSLQAEALESPA